MTDAELLDHFAAAALPALIADPDLNYKEMCLILREDDKSPVPHEKWLEIFYRYTARLAYGHAKAMMAERQKK